MKKILLLGCAAGIFYACAVGAQNTNNVIVPAPVTIVEQADKTVSVPTTEEITTAFHALLRQQGINVPSEIRTVADGDHFTVTVPAFSAQVLETSDEKTAPEEGAEIVTRTIPEQTFTLVRNGDFNGKAQYDIEPATLERLKNIISSFFPTMDINADQFKGKITWVPALNLVSQYSLNTQKFHVALPNVFNAISEQFVSDRLTQIQGDKMDMAISTDIRDMVLTLPFITLRVPNMSQNASWVASAISGDSATMTLTADKVTGVAEARDVTMTLSGAKQPLASATTRVQSTIDKDIRVMVSLSDMQLDTALPIPPQLIPTDIQSHITISGIDRSVLQELLTQETELSQLESEDIPDTDRIQALEEKLDNGVRQLTQQAVLTIDPLVIKNDTASITVTGTVQNQKNTEDELSPVIDMRLSIVNFDAISPAPHVDQAACAQARKDAKSGKGSQTKATIACTPKGGILDDLRPYLNPQDRTTDASGNTTDVIVIHYQDDTITLNGKAIKTAETDSLVAPGTIDKTDQTAGNNA